MFEKFGIYKAAPRLYQPCVPARDALRAAYVYHRQQKRHGASGPERLPALDAIANARADVEAGRTRYPEHAAGMGPALDYGGESCRWVEAPAKFGLRFVGYADELSRAIRHEGWLIGPDGCDGDVHRGVVYQLPARKGRVQFVYGHADPYNYGPAVLAFGDVVEAPDVEDCAEAARHADEFSRVTAEREREYQEAARAGAECAELEREAVELRAGVRAVIRSAKADLDIDAATWRVVRDRVRNMLTELCRTREKRDELRATYEGAEGFADYYG